MKRINFKWVVPIILCYSVVGILIYASIKTPENELVYAISILAVTLLTIAIVLGLDSKSKSEKAKK